MTMNLVVIRWEPKLRTKKNCLTISIPRKKQFHETISNIVDHTNTYSLQCDSAKLTGVSANEKLLLFHVNFYPLLSRHRIPYLSFYTHKCKRYSCKVTKHILCIKIVEAVEFIVNLCYVQYLLIWYLLIYINFLIVTKQIRPTEG